MSEEKKVKQEVRKVSNLTEEQAKIFNLTKEQALEMLKEVTTSEQMLNKWCRDGDISAVRIATGPVNERGIRISEKSLQAFIIMKKDGTKGVEDLLDEIEKMKQEKADLLKQIKELKESGIRKPRAKKITLKNAFVMLNELHFEHNRAKHKAIFKDGELLKIERNSRTGFQDITEDTEDELKEVIISEYKEKSKK